jgi:hypothetical protein
MKGRLIKRKRIQRSDKTKAEFLALGYFSEKDVEISHKRSNRQKDPLLEPQFDNLWRDLRAKAKKLGKICYNGTGYRLNNLKVEKVSGEKVGQAAKIEESAISRERERERFCIWNFQPSNIKWLLPCNNWLGLF